MALENAASAGQDGATVRSSRVPVTLTQQQWTALAPLIPGGDSPARGRLAAPRGVVEGILYALRNGIGMQSVPPPYPSGSTLYRRYTAWTSSGHWDPIWAAFLDTLSPSERQQWEAAAARRPGSAADAEQSVDATLETPADVSERSVEPVAPQRVAAAPSHDVELVAEPVSDAPGQHDSREPAPDEHDSWAPATDELAEPARDEPAPAGIMMSAEAAREQVAQRLQLSAAEAEIVSRRIGDHGVVAALIALDEAERRVATDTLRGVGGMPMSPFEIWVCAVGLARRPVERPRGPKPERNDRNDRQEADRDRRRRQWRKTP